MTLQLIRSHKVKGNSHIYNINFDFDVIQSLNVYFKSRRGKTTEVVITPITIKNIVLLTPEILIKRNTCTYLRRNLQTWYLVFELDLNSD